MQREAETKTAVNLPLYLLSCISVRKVGVQLYCTTLDSH